MAVSRGNPGLQDLTVLRLVYGQQVSAERAEAAVAGMEAYLQRGELPEDAEARAFLENLAIDALLEEAARQAARCCAPPPCSPSRCLPPSSTPWRQRPGENRNG